MSARSVARATTSGLSAMLRHQSFLASLAPREAAMKGGQTMPPRSKGLRLLRLKSLRLRPPLEGLSGSQMALGRILMSMHCEGSCI